MTHDTKRFDITGSSTTKATAPRAQLLTSTSPSTLHRPRRLRSQTSSGQIATWLKRHQGHSAKSPVAHFEEPLYPAQATTLHRPRCLRSQTSSGYIATWLKRHQGHSAKSPVAHFDEPLYPAQATLPQESDQLRIHRHLA